MRGAHAVSGVGDQQSPLDRSLQLLGALDRRQLTGVKVRAQRDRHEQTALRCRQRRHPGPEHLLDPAGQRNVRANLRQTALQERASELEHEQRVAERDIDDAAQQLARQAQAEPLGQHPPRGADAQRPDLKALQPAALERPLERRRIIAAARQQEANGLAAEPARHKRQRLGRGRVEPLDVVDRDQQRRVRTQIPQHAQKSERDRVRLRRRPARRRAQQHHLQRGALW